MTDKKGIPISVVISPASTHDINLVTDVVDNAVIKRPKSISSSSKPRSGRRKRRQHLCLDKGYKSSLEKQELIKRGYVLHTPIKKKRRKGKGEDEKEGKVMPFRKKYSPKRWVVERTNSWHNRFRKLFTRYEKKVRQLSWISTVLLLHNYLQKDNFGIGS